MRLRASGGITLVEVMIAAALLGIVFLAATAVQISSLSFLNGMMNAPDVNAAIAFEQMVRDVKRATDVAVETSAGASVSAGTAGPQLKLIVETATPPDSTYTGDRWIVYGILGGKLRWKTYTTDATGPPSAAPEITAGDAEVLSGLNLASASGFTIVNPVSGSGTATQVNINLTVQKSNASDVTFTTNVLPSRSKK